jgi:hypothetical protein
MHGHIQVYKNTEKHKWFSDYKQKNFHHYEDGHIAKYKVYRLQKVTKKIK